MRGGSAPGRIRAWPRHPRSSGRQHRCRNGMPSRTAKTLRTLTQAGYFHDVGQQSARARAAGALVDTTGGSYRGGSMPQSPGDRRLAGGLILRHDRGGDTATLVHLETAALGPFTDLGTLLPPAAGLWLALPPAARRRGTARVLHERADLETQFLGVLRARVDLIGGAIEWEDESL